MRAHFPLIALADSSTLEALRKKTPALQAVDSPEKDQRVQIWGEPTQERTGGKQGDAEDKETLAAKDTTEPAGERNHDGGAHDVRSEHPGGLIHPGGQVAPDMPHRNVGNRHIQRLEDSGQHDSQGNQPFIGR